MFLFHAWRKCCYWYGGCHSKNIASDPNPLLLQGDVKWLQIRLATSGLRLALTRKLTRVCDLDVETCFRLVGGAGGLPACQRFFRYTYFVINEVSDFIVERILRRQVIW